MSIKFSREWGMPNGSTFSIPPIRKFVDKYAELSTYSMDMFARDDKTTSVTNDLNPNTSAEYHLQALEFCLLMQEQQREFDLVIFDPPYSPRQVSECYQNIGIKTTMSDTQTGTLYKSIRDAFDPLVLTGGVVLSFGWNSVGMGKNRGYEIEEILLVSHGGPHNDTICLAERKIK